MLAGVQEGTKPLLTGVQKNRDQWQRLADSRAKGNVSGIRLVFFV